MLEPLAQLERRRLELRSNAHLSAIRLREDGRLKMNDQQKKDRDSGVRDREIRAALDQHWAASDANDFETEYPSITRTWC